MARVWGAGHRRRVFDPPKTAHDRRIRSDGQDRPADIGPDEAQAGARARAAFPAQAQVAAWARGRAAARVGRGPISVLGEMNSRQ